MNVPQAIQILSTNNKFYLYSAFQILKDILQFNENTINKTVIVTYKKKNEIQDVFLTVAGNE